MIHQDWCEECGTRQTAGTCAECGCHVCERCLSQGREGMCIFCVDSATTEEAR